MPDKDEDMPGELLKVFPANNLQMMFLSGAKGTQVTSIAKQCLYYMLSLPSVRLLNIDSEKSNYQFSSFLHATAVTAVVHLSHHNSVCLSITRVNMSKTLQARVTKSSPAASGKTLVLGSIKLSINSKGVTPSKGTK